MHDLHLTQTPLAPPRRTDAGVSAISQWISFYTWVPLDPPHVARALSRLEHLKMRGLHRVPRSFHATFGAKWRRYNTL